MRIVALTFHDVVPDEQAAAKPGDGFYRITVSEFERLLSQLRKRGYQSVSSRAFREWQQGTLTLPERSVVLTFDDGYTSHFELVAPLLKRYQFSGTFFIPVGSVGQGGHVTWAQLGKMVFLGMEIGTHGMSHRPLTELSREELEAEVADSKRLLEERLGVPIRAIAAPGGFWNRAAAEAVERCGYEAAWISEIGTNGPDTQPMALRRIVVRQPVAIDRVVSMVEGWQPAFWWAANQQLLIRLLKRVLGVYWYERLKRKLVPNA